MPIALQPTDALFLDIDGTLLDIAPQPDMVVVPQGLILLLELLRRRLQGAVAILSGRSVEQVDELFAPICFAVAGEHGAVIRVSPTGPVERLTARIPAELVRRIEATVTDLPGVLVEIKSAAIAVHFRAAPQHELALSARLRQSLSAFPTWSMMRGRLVFDIAAAGSSKGRALELLLRAKPFYGRRPVVIGDDVTDLSAFDTAKSRGGAALSVHSNLFSADDAHFAGPETVRTWLEAAALKLPPADQTRA